MFKALYHCPRTVARHETGPLYESRRRYLEHVAAQGASLHTLRAVAGVIYRAAVDMGLDESSPVERTAVEEAAKRWANRSFPNTARKAGYSSERDFRGHTCGWLRFAGRLRESDRVLPPHHEQIEIYCIYLESERGLSPATIATARQQVAKFFRYVQKPLKQLSIADVERFLAKLGDQGWTRHGIVSIAHHLRGFFFYGEQQRWTKAGVGQLIRGPRVYRHEHLPLGPAWSDVQRLLESTQTDRKTDIRDRAILLLLAVYGLRVSEVRRLRLDDIDWKEKTITIPRTKQRRARMCPLIGSLAEAIARYIREVRPNAPYRELFLRMNAPHRPFSPGGVYGAVAYRLERLGIVSPRCGPHALRHACATHLLAQGLTLTEVGGHLGHQCVESTRVYAKVDMATLRVVADLDLGGLL